MSEFDDYGGLSSVTGSVGGGSGTYNGDRGILFPEFDKWARQNNLIMKTSTNARQTKENGISEKKKSKNDDILIIFDHFCPAVPKKRFFLINIFN